MRGLFSQFHPTIVLETLSEITGAAFLPEWVSDSFQQRGPGDVAGSSSSLPSSNILQYIFHLLQHPLGATRDATCAQLGCPLNTEESLEGVRPAS